MPPKFSPPTDDDKRQLAKQWLAVEKLVKEDYQTSLDQSESTLTLLQRILDNDLIGTNEYGLQCLGVVLGRIMAHNIPGLDWCIIEDEYGRDPCLRYKQSTFRCNPITMISKRILRGEAVVVSDLYQSSKQKILETAPSAD